MSSIEYSKDASTVGMVDFGVETFYARLVGPFVRVGSKDALLVNILSHLLIDLSRTILLGSGIGSGLAIHIWGEVCFRILGRNGIIYRNGRRLLSLCWESPWRLECEWWIRGGFVACFIWSLVESLLRCCILMITLFRCFIVCFFLLILFVLLLFLFVVLLLFIVQGIHGLFLQLLIVIDCLNRSLVITFLLILYKIIILLNLFKLFLLFR